MGIPGVLLNKSDILRAALNNYGIVKYVADVLGCHRDTLYDWIDKDNEVKEAFTRARQRYQRTIEEEDYELVRKAYDSAGRLIEADHAGVVMFTLERKGKWNKQDAPSNQPSTIVYQVNNGNDSTGNTVSLPSPAISNQDSDSAA